jgi:hypothetical protein
MRDVRICPHGTGTDLPSAESGLGLFSLQFFLSKGHECSELQGHGREWL